jgi:hypothetical protein
MKLVFIILIASCLFNFSICENYVWFEDQLNDNYVNAICELYTGSPTYMIYKAKPMRCLEYLKKEWLMVYPVASCLVEFGDDKHFLVFNANLRQRLYEGGEAFLGLFLMCSRFIFKKVPGLINNEAIDNQLTVANNLLISRKYDGALAGFNQVLKMLKEVPPRSNYIQSFIYYIHENIAYIAYKQLENERSSENKETLKDAFNISLQKLDPNKPSYFTKLLFGLFNMVDGKDDELTVKSFKQAGKLNKRNFLIASMFVQYGRYCMLETYLSESIAIEGYNTKNYLKTLKTNLDQLKGENSNISQLNKGLSKEIVERDAVRNKAEKFLKSLNLFEHRNLKDLLVSKINSRKFKKVKKHYIKK